MKLRFRAGDVRRSSVTLRLRTLQIAANQPVSLAFSSTSEYRRVGSLTPSTRQFFYSAAVQQHTYCMSSLHSCHWDWCRFTTVLHDDFVEHVVSVHLNKAEPVKRADISLIHHVEQGASGHSDSSVGGILSVEASGAQSEALESTTNDLVPPRPDYTKNALSFTSGSTYILPLSQQKQQTTGSSAEGISQFNPRSQAQYKSQSFD